MNFYFSYLSTLGEKITKIRVFILQSFAFDGSILFSYTKCATLSTPDLGGGVSISIGLFGNKNDIPGESYVLAAGAGIPEVTYSTDGSRVIAMGANFGRHFSVV